MVYLARAGVQLARVAAGARVDSVGTVFVPTGLAEPISLRVEQTIERVLDRLQYDLTDVLLQQALVELHDISQRDYGPFIRLRGRAGRGP